LGFGFFPIEGKVYVSSLIKASERISKIIVLNGLCESCEKEAVILVKNMPEWVLVKNNGKFNNSKIIPPLKFILIKK
jgi:hypothetical protein